MNLDREGIGRELRGGTNLPPPTSKIRIRADRGLRLSGHSRQYNAVLAVLSTALGDVNRAIRLGNPKVSPGGKPFRLLDLRNFHDTRTFRGYSERLEGGPSPPFSSEGEASPPRFACRRAGTRAGGSLLVLSDAGLIEAMCWSTPGVDPHTAPPRSRLRRLGLFEFL
jgi:hypothetical protein